MTIALSPFKGLMPYSESETDARYFFGREKERDIIIANLQASRLTLLYGASGVGKSSVLRAGVVYQLRMYGQESLRERDTPEFCVVKFSRWRDDPVAGLLDSVRRSVEETLNRQDLEPAPPSAPLVEQLRHWTNVVNADLLIILDQFEEYFLYHPQDEREGSFDVEFARAARDQRLRVNFLISIREDSLAKLDRFTGRVPHLFSNRLRIEHLSAQAAREAIEKTVAEYNLTRSDAQSQISVEPKLVDEVLEGLRAGESPLMDNERADSVDEQKVQIEAPLFQLVMTRLWDEEMSAGSSVLRHATLERFGGTENILQNYLSLTIDKLSKREQEIAAQIFRYLVTPSGTKIAQTATDLAAYCAFYKDEVQQVLVKLSEVRILRAIAPPSDQLLEPRYEIFHDVLASAITNWRLSFEQQASFREFTLEQKARYLRRGFMALLCVSVLLLILTGYAWRQRTYALQQKAIATDALMVADMKRDEALKQQVRAEEQREIAVANEKDALLQKSIAVTERQRAQEAQGEAVKQKQYALQQVVIARRAEASALRDRNAALKAERATQVAFQKEKLARFAAMKAQEAASLSEKNAVAAAEKATKLAAVAEGALKVADAQTLEAKNAQKKSEEERRRANDALETLKKSDEQPAFTYAVVREVNRPLSAVSLSPDLRSMVVTGDKGEVVQWDTTELTKSYYERTPVFSKGGNATPVPPATSSGTGENSHSSVKVESGEAKLTAKEDKTERLLKSLGGTIKKTFINSERNLLVTVNNSGTASIWNLQTCATPDIPCQPVPLKAGGAAVTTVAFSPQNPNQFATGDGKGGTQIWDLNKCLTDGKCEAVKNLPGNGKSLNSVAFNRRGDRLVTASEDGTARIWDVVKRKKKLTLQPRSGLLIRKTFERKFFGIPFIKIGRPKITFFPIKTAVFNPEDDNLVITGSDDGMLRLWDVKSGTSFLTLRGHSTAIRSVSFSPHGKYLISASDDLTVRIWEPCESFSKKYLFETNDDKLLGRFGELCRNPNLMNEKFPSKESKEEALTTIVPSTARLSH